MGVCITLKPLSIGFVGNMPQPFGGVATFCYHFTAKLLADGHKVSFYDAYFHSHKTRPSGLTCYGVAPKGRSLQSVFVFVNVLSRTLFDRKLRIFIGNLFTGLCHVGLPRISIKMTILVILRVFDLWRFFKDREIDIFHGQHAGCDTFALLMLAKHYFMRPCLVTVHGSEFTMPQNRKLLPLANYVCTNSDAVMCNSKYTHQQMKEVGINPKVSSVIYLGIDPIHFRLSKEIPGSLQALINLKERVPIILYVGWLIARKGPQIFLESLSELTYLNWRAVFVGPDHGLKTFLCQRAEKLNLADHVSILSDVPTEDLLAIYDSADIFVFPTLSKDEGFGLVALEAMAHGMPVIASRVGAIPETVIDGETGLFFDPGDFKGLSKQIERLLCDVELQSKMGAAASRWVKENFSWDRTTNQVVSLYESIIKTYGDQAV